MSETARIREAARALGRQRPDDTRDGGRVLGTAHTKPAAIDMAASYRQLAQRASEDLGRRITGIGYLYGEDASQPLLAAHEEEREMFYGALDMHELAHHDRDRYVQRLRSQQADDIAEVRAELLRYRAYLGAARLQEARRRLRDGKTRPAWLEKSADLFDNEDSF